MKEPICVCGSRRFQVLLEGDYSFFKIQGKPVPFQALKCLDCRMVLTNPPPSGSETYNDDAETDAKTHDDLSLIESSIYRIGTLKPYLNSSTKILEIGCSTGKLVEMAQQMGVQESIGIEISASAANCGKKLGRDIRDVYLGECNFPSNHFDIIQAHHVLEHIPDLRQTLNEISIIIKANGIFYVTVPRYNSVFVRDSNWMGWFPQEHFWHFTEKTLSSLLAQYGFKMLEFCCPLHSDVYTKKNSTYPIKKTIKFLVKKFNFGDTVEALFIKND